MLFVVDTAVLRINMSLELSMFISNNRQLISLTIDNSTTMYYKMINIFPMQHCFDGITQELLGLTKSQNSSIDLLMFMYSCTLLFRTLFFSFVLSTLINLELCS